MRRNRAGMTADKDEGFPVRQLRDGIVGGLCAVLPLLVVNVLGYLGLLDSQQALIAGALALFGGPLIGGGVAGLRGGRDRDAPGAAGALRAGVVASVLYLATLLALVAVAVQVGTEPLIIAEHPLRVGGAMVSLATLLAVVALGVGALASRNSPRPQRAARRIPPEPARTPDRVPATRAARRAEASSSDGRTRAAHPSRTPPFGVRH